MGYLGEELNITTYGKNLTISHSVSATSIAWIILNTVIFFVGCAGNLLVIYYFGWKRKLTFRHHIYFVHLAVAGLLMSALWPIFAILHHRIETKLIDHFFVGLITICNWCGNVSAWLLANISYERYVGIVTPLKPRLSRKRIHLTALIAWPLSIAFLLPLLVNQSCVNSPSKSTFQFVYSIVYFTTQSLLPCVFILFTTIKSFLVLRKSLMDHHHIQKYKGIRSSCFSESGLDFFSVVPPYGRRRSSLSVFKNQVLMSSPIVKILPRRFSLSQSILNKVDTGEEDKQEIPKQRNRMNFLLLAIGFFIVSNSSSHFTAVYRVGCGTVSEASLWLSEVEVINTASACFYYAIMDGRFVSFCIQLFSIKKKHAKLGDVTKINN